MKIETKNCTPPRLVQLSTLKPGAVFCKDHDIPRSVKNDQLYLLLAFVSSYARVWNLSAHGEQQFLIEARVLPVKATLILEP